MISFVSYFMRKDVRVKFIKILSLLTVLIFPVASLCQGVVIQNGFLTGNTFRALDETSKNVYVVGLIDGMFLAPMFGAPEDNLDNLAECTVGMTGQQLVAIFEKYLNNNPERWNQSMHAIGYSAMLNACKK